MNDIIDLTKKDKSIPGGQGVFAATPLEFEIDGITYVYSGRGRWSSQLATKVSNESKAPEKNKNGEWTWRDATADELASAEKLIANIANRIKTKNDAVALRLAIKISKKISADNKVTQKVHTELTAPV